MSFFLHSGQKEGSGRTGILKEIRQNTRFNRLWTSLHSLPCTPIAMFLLTSRVRHGIANGNAASWLAKSLDDKRTIWNLSQIKFMFSKICLSRCSSIMIDHTWTWEIAKKVGNCILTRFLDPTMFTPWVFRCITYTLFQNVRHFSILLFACKLALVASFKGKYSFEFWF